MAHVRARSDTVKLKVKYRQANVQLPFVVRWLKIGFYTLKVQFTRLLGFSFYNVDDEKKQQLIRDDKFPESLYTKIIQSTKRFKK